MAICRKRLNPASNASVERKPLQDQHLSGQHYLASQHYSQGLGLVQHTDPARPIRVWAELPERYEHVGIGRRMARAMLEHCQCHPRDVDETETVIGELCGNAARHARSACGWYSCTVEYHRDRIIVIVTDQGQGFDHEDVPAVGTARDDGNGAERYGGFGLLLVGELVDRIEFGRTEPQGTTVRTEKRLQSSDAKL